MTTIAVAVAKDLADLADELHRTFGHLNLDRFEERVLFVATAAQGRTAEDGAVILTAISKAFIQQKAKPSTARSSTAGEKVTPIRAAQAKQQ